MPVDHKRINGPELTLPYQLFEKLNTKTLKAQFHEIVKPTGVRSDSRTLNQQRCIYLKSGVVSQAKGSAYIELGETKVIVSVFDPREIPNKTDYCSKGDLYCEFKFAPFSCHKRRLHQLDAEEEQSSAIMKQALEAAVCRHEFPNFQVDIYAMVLHNDGSALSAAITAAGLALAHAGIPMYDLITSTSVAVQGKCILLDPSAEEERLVQAPLDEANSEHGVIVLAMLTNTEQVSQFHQTGNLSLESVTSCLEQLKEATKDVSLLVQKCLVKHVAESSRNIED